MFSKLNISLVSAATAAVLLFAPHVSATPSVPAECGYVAHWDVINPDIGAMQTPTSPPSMGTCAAGDLNTMVAPTLVLDEGWGATITLPNFIDDLPLKEVWVRVMTWENPDFFQFSVKGYDMDIGGGATPIDGELHGFSRIDGGFIAHFWMTPNPDRETIEIIPLFDSSCMDICTVDTGAPILGVWVSTVSRVPEPGTLALFGLGLVGLGFARRRKTAA